MKINTSEHFKHTRSSYYITENILDWPGQLAVIKLSPPMVFVRFDEASAYFASYEEWRDEIFVVEWIGGEKPNRDEQEAIFTDIWNFLVQHEEEEERQAEDRMDFDDY